MTNSEILNDTCECVDCGGKGYVIPLLRDFTIKCDRCKETGRMPVIMLEWIKIGEKYKKKRMENREMLREYAIRTGIDVMDVSYAERGIIDPLTVFTD